MAVASPSRLGFVAMITSVTPVADALDQLSHLEILRPYPVHGVQDAMEDVVEPVKAAGALDDP